MTIGLIQKPYEDDQVKMKAFEWHGKKDVRLNTNRKKPKITQEDDILVRVTSTTICGTDLHIYHNAISGLVSGMIPGHECVGIIEDMGSNAATYFKIGDRVAVSSQVADGVCEFCQSNQPTLCELENSTTNQIVKEGKKPRAAGIFGFPESLNGYQGAQAEYIRIPNAKYNALKIPNDHHVLSEENALLLTDILTTSWHACVLGDVKEGDIVAIWGAGPVGILCAYLCSCLKASQILLIDYVEERLQLAKKYIPSLHTLNFKTMSEKEVPHAVRKVLRPYSASGPNVVIDCVGCHYSKSWRHSIQTTFGLETDAIDSVEEAIHSVAKGGRVSIIGYYTGEANHFPIGLVLEKGLTLRSGRVPNQAYWHDLLDKILQKQIDPSFIFTHKIPFDDLGSAYKIFDTKENGMVKVMAIPQISKLQ